MQGVRWIPQVISKTRLSIKPKLKCISTREDSFKRMVLYFRIFEPDSLGTVNQCMKDKGITGTNLLSWYMLMIMNLY